jgi:hypothetical protein
MEFFFLKAFVVSGGAAFKRLQDNHPEQQLLGRQHFFKKMRKPQHER